MPRKSSVQHDDLDLEMDLAFESRTYRAQQIIWAVMAFALVAAVLGLFGTGVFSDASKAADGQPALKVRFDRTIRMQSENELIVEVSNPPPSPAETVEVEISRSLLADTHLTEVNPDPEGVTATDESYVYEFKVSDWTDMVAFYFEFRHDHWGTVEGEVRVKVGEVESAAVSVSQLVYP